MTRPAPPARLRVDEGFRVAYADANGLVLVNGSLWVQRWYGDPLGSSVQGVADALLAHAHAELDGWGAVGIGVIDSSIKVRPRESARREASRLDREMARYHLVHADVVLAPRWVVAVARAFTAGLRMGSPRVPNDLFGQPEQAVGFIIATLGGMESIECDLGAVRSGLYAMLEASAQVRDDYRSSAVQEARARARLDT